MTDEERVGAVRSLFPNPPFPITIQGIEFKEIQSGEEFSQEIEDGWVDSDHVRQINVSLHFPDLRISGQAAVGILEDNGLPAIRKNLFAKNITIEDELESIELKTILNAKNNEISRVSDSLELEHDTVSKSQSYSEELKSCAEFAVHGISMPMNLFPQYWSYSSQKNSLKRHQSFETFVKGELQKVAETAEKLLKTTENAFPEIPTSDSLVLRMDASGILIGREKTIILQFIAALTKRKDACLIASKVSQIPDLPDRASLVGLVNVARKKAQQARIYEKDAKKQNRPQLEKSRKELAARKWLNQQRKAIDAEIDRLVAVKKLETAIRLTNTVALSKKKSLLADDLITNAYVNRFKNELSLLKAGHLPVELKKTRADVGHVYHQIFLKNIRAPGVKTIDILSEGEFRIISLAAFLADSEGRGAKTPFVFDDPISSLDQPYEEATARRLTRWIPPPSTCA